MLPDGDYQLLIGAAGVSDLAGNAMSNDVTLNFFVLKGDLNRDGHVSISDLITLASNFGKTSDTYADGDLNYDGTVSISDFIDLSANFNKSIPAPGPFVVSVPAAPAELVISSNSDSVFLDQNKSRGNEKATSRTILLDLPLSRRVHHHRKRVHKNR